MAPIPKRTVTLDIPESWIPTLMLIPVNPDDDDTLEQRLYDAILRSVDDVTEALYREKNDFGPSS